MGHAVEQLFQTSAPKGTTKWGVVVGGWVVVGLVVGFFCFFVCLALFIDVLTDKVRFLSSSGSGGQCLGSNGPSDHCRMQPHFDCAWSRKKQWW